MVNGKFFYLPCQCVSRSSWMGIWSESEMGQMFSLELIKFGIMYGFKIFIFEILTHMPHGPHDPSYPCMGPTRPTCSTRPTRKYMLSYDAVLAPTSLLWKVDMGGEGRWGSGEEEEEIPSSENIHEIYIFGFNILIRWNIGDFYQEYSCGNIHSPGEMRWIRECLWGGGSKILINFARNINQFINLTGNIGDFYQEYWWPRTLSTYQVRWDGSEKVCEEVEAKDLCCCIWNFEKKILWKIL